MTALFIVNPLSERVARKGSLLELYYKRFKDSQTINIHIIDDFRAMTDIVDRALAQNTISHVFIEGGDGTAQGVLTAFLNAVPDNMPRFTLLPGGMTNQVAKNIGLRKMTLTAVRAIMTNNNTQNTTTPLIHITSEFGPDTYGFLFSTGAVPMITQYTKHHIHGKGIGGSLAVLGGILKGISGHAHDIMHPTDIDLQTPAHNHSEKHLGTLVTTLPNLILGLNPFWGNQGFPLRILYANAKARRLFRNVIGLWLGFKNKDRSHDGLYSWTAHHIDYSYTGPIVLDGEPLTAIGPTFSLRVTQPLKFVR